MEAVFSRINELSKLHDQRLFFQLLDGPGSPAEVRALVPALTFFVFAFQDILRLNERQMTDPELLAVARQHRAEDAGHQSWFLQDARTLDVELNIERLFGADHRVTRDTSYRLVSEVFRASDDRVRIVIPIVLEATGHCFFRRVYRFIESAGLGTSLKYFGERHWQVEEGHEMLQEGQSDVLRKLALSPALRAECIQSIERMFIAMATMVDDFHARMRAAKTEPAALETVAPEAAAVEAAVTAQPRARASR